MSSINQSFDSSLAATVIICAHNPRPDALRQTLQALQGQSLPSAQWELLLVDNASAEPLASNWNLDWHPNSRHVRENELGLTPARLRGIAEARSQLLVFVDDDNLLAADYLERAVEISTGWPMLGAWGGRIEARYEVVPPDWAGPYLGMLAIREFQGDHWSNSYDDLAARPYGAGMIVRLEVASAYAANVQSNPAKRGLGRSGGRLLSGEDEDMAMTAIDVGKGVGMFERLSLIHLIPANRLSEPYLLNLAENTAFSGVILHSMRGRLPSPQGWARRIYSVVQLLSLDSRGRRFARARRRGMASARAWLARSKRVM